VDGGLKKEKKRGSCAKQKGKLLPEAQESSMSTMRAKKRLSEKGEEEVLPGFLDIQGKPGSGCQCKRIIRRKKEKKCVPTCPRGRGLKARHCKKPGEPKIKGGRGREMSSIRRGACDPTITTTLRKTDRKEEGFGSCSQPEEEVDGPQRGPKGAGKK